jgi:O-antigen ligase
MVVKIILADYRYFVTLGRDLGGHSTLLGHEDSYFIAMFLVAIVLGFAWGLRSRIFIVGAAITGPLALVALLANQRRVGTYALVAALLVILLMAYTFEPRIRKHLVVVAAVLSIGVGVLIASSWNDQYGFRGQLVRPVRTFFDPTVRDFQSDTYRTAENSDLRLSMQSDSIIGMGFGKPFLTVFPLADISQYYPLWNVIPHNTLMWVGVRLGFLGFAAFWALIGMALLQAFSIARARSDPLIRAVAVFAAAAVIAELVVAYGDLQLENERNMIFFGVVLGLLARLSLLPDAGVTKPAAVEQPKPLLAYRGGRPG